MKFISCYIIVFISIIFQSGLLAQNNINWLSLEEVEQLSKIQRKKVFIEVYTDWCGWCKKMEHTTLTNDNIKKYINEEYYAVRINPEKIDKITWKGTEYNRIKYGNRFINEWAIYHLQGQMSFPSIIFLDENLNTIQHIPGFHDEKMMSAILTYFRTNSHKSIPWFKYINQFDANDFLMSTSNNHKR